MRLESMNIDIFYLHSDSLRNKAMNYFKTDSNGIDSHHNKIETCAHQFNIDPRYFIESLINGFNLSLNQILIEKQFSITC